MTALDVPVADLEGAPIAARSLRLTEHTTVTVMTPPGAHWSADTDTCGPPAQAVPAADSVDAAALWAAACAEPGSRSWAAATAATCAAWLTPSVAAPWRPRNTNSNT